MLAFDLATLYVDLSVVNHKSFLSRLTVPVRLYPGTGFLYQVQQQACHSNHTHVVIGVTSVLNLITNEQLSYSMFSVIKRPLNLFRHCTDVASHQAKLLYTQWRTTGDIVHPFQGVAISVDVVTCHAELWKLTACSLHIQPCHPSTHATVLCRSVEHSHYIYTCGRCTYDVSTSPFLSLSNREDCLTLMRDCMTSGNSMTAEEVCEDLSPSYLQDSCVSLSEFLGESGILISSGLTPHSSPEPSTYTPHQASSLTYPCDSNPCANGRNCTVNHNCRHDDPTCIPYTCLPSCSLSDGTHLALKGVPSAHIALPVKKKDCFGYVMRGSSEGTGCGYGDTVYAAYCEDQGLEGCCHNGTQYGKPTEQLQG